MFHRLYFYILKYELRTNLESRSELNKLKFCGDGHYHRFFQPPRRNSRYATDRSSNSRKGWNGWIGWPWKCRGQCQPLPWCSASFFCHWEVLYPEVIWTEQGKRTSGRGITLSLKTGVAQQSSLVRLSCLDRDQDRTIRKWTQKGRMR